MRCGWAGEDSPKTLFPEAVGYRLEDMTTDAPAPSAANEDAMDVVAEGADSAPSTSGEPKKQLKTYIGSSALGYRRDGMEIAHCMKDGLINDFSILQHMWEHAFAQLAMDPRENPVLLTEPAFNTRPIRERSLEILFERFQAHSSYLGKNPVLTAFSAGRSSALVLDIGHHGAVATPISDGYTLNRGIVRTPIGGDAITRFLWHLCIHKNINIRAPYTFTRRPIAPGQFEVRDLSFPGTHPSYHDWCVKEVVNDMKESATAVAENPFVIQPQTAFPAHPWELPDGSKIDIGAERFISTEILFNPTLLPPTIVPPPAVGIPGLPPVHLGVQQLPIEAIARSEIDVRRDLYANLIIAGGTSLFPGLVNRLTRELADKTPPMVKAKILASNFASERRYSAWIGGSILGSLGTFQQMWISKQEYDEAGPAIIERKCPM